MGEIMFTLEAGFLIAIIGWVGTFSNAKERETYDKLSDGGTEDELLRAVTLHIRQDIWLIAFLLGGILLALGVVADRLR